jgi:hypothetical protein
MRHAALLMLILRCCGDGGDQGLGDLVDLSVNQASATSDTDGLTLRTEAGTNAAGGFNGTGTGNKAIAGVTGWDGRPLADLDHLALETTLVTGTRSTYFNVIVDLDCDGARLSLVVADPTGLASTSGAAGDRYELDADEAVWRAVGGLDDLLPGHTDPDAGTLTSVADAYPDACLRDAATGDNGMPAGVVTPAVLVILGDSVNDTENEQLVGAIEVGGSRYTAE